MTRRKNLIFCMPFHQPIPPSTTMLTVMQLLRELFFYKVTYQSVNLPSSNGVQVQCLTSKIGQPITCRTEPPELYKVDFLLPTLRVH